MELRRILLLLLSLNVRRHQIEGSDVIVVIVILNNHWDLWQIAELENP